MKVLLPLLSVCASAVLASSLAHGNVLVVDHSGGGMFTTIQAAVNASQNGDTILIKSGDYPAFSIVNRALYVVADTNANVNVYGGGTLVRNLAADRDVVLANLTMSGQVYSFDEHTDALRLKNDLGSVRVQGCNLTGGDSAPTVPAPACAGAEIEGCMDVAFVGCSIKGGVLNPYPTGRTAIAATGSTIAVYDSQVTGGAGNSICRLTYHDPNGFPGGDGVDLIDSFLFASGSSITGGRGGDASGDVCGNGHGGNGGAGISLFGSTSVTDAEVLDTQLAGGQGGLGFNGLDGNQGPTSFVGTGCTLDTLSGSKRVLHSPSVVRELAPLALSFHGQPGDLVGMYVGTSTAFHYLPAQEGVKLVSGNPPPVYATMLGSADAGGNLSTSYSFPDLGPGVQAREYYLQAIVITAQGSRVLGSPISLTVLDSAF